MAAKRAFPVEQEHHPLHVTHSAPLDCADEPPEKQSRAMEDESDPDVIIEDIATTISRLQEENKEIFMKWREEFSAAENFELLCPSRLDELLKEAYALEASLIDQKEKMKDGLKDLSKTLGVIVDISC